MKIIVEALVYQAVDEINSQLPLPMQLQKSPTAVILGDESVLDSMSFVMLLSAIEARVEQGFQVSISLGEESDSGALEHYRSLGSLIEYIASIDGLVSLPANSMDRKVPG